MPNEDFIISTSILLVGAIIFALLDTVYISILVRRITPDFFAKLKWLLATFSGLIWFGIWKWVLSVFWDNVYVFVFPVWGRQWIPLLFGVLMASVTIGFWSIAMKTSDHPLLVFLLLSGFWGVLTHLWAIYRGILTKPPMLRGSSPFAALLIAFFEYIFYWCIITSLSSTLFWIKNRFRSN